MIAHGSQAALGEHLTSGMDRGVGTQKAHLDGTNHRLVLLWIFSVPLTGTYVSISCVLLTAVPDCTAVVCSLVYIWSRGSLDDKVATCIPGIRQQCRLMTRVYLRPFDL